MRTSEGTTGRRERKRQQMLDHLATTGAQLFAAHGYARVTMESIAETADVAKRTLYNHFPTKDALLAHWIDTQLQADLARLAPEIGRRRRFTSRVKCLLDASADWCAQHPDYLAAYLRHRLLSVGEPQPSAASDGDAPAARGDIAHAWTALIKAGQTNGELTRRLSAAQLATWFHHLYLGTLLRWLSTPGLVLRDEFAAMVDLFVHGAHDIA